MTKRFTFSRAGFFYITVFLNAFIDLGHKIVIQNTVFKLYDGPQQIVLTAILNACILLPYIALMSPAGFISDRFYKTVVMRMACWVTVVCCMLITVFYLQGLFWPAFAMTLALAAQSCFFSPAKYGYIKEYFGKARLGEVNGIVASLSIVAILAGTFVYTLFFEGLYVAEAATEAEVLRNIAPIGFLLITAAVLQLALIYRIPQGEAVLTERPFNLSRYFTGRLIVEDLAPLKRTRAIRQAVIGLTMFWSVGQVMVAAFPAHIKGTMGVTNTIIAQGILACSGIGIAMGSWIAGRMSRNYIETGLLPIAALGLATGLLILPGITTPFFAVLDFLFIGMMGGMFIVPLYALVQFFADEKALGKTLAASNWVQNIGMLTFLGFTVLFSLLGVSSKSQLQVIALVALGGGLYTLSQLPQSLARFILTFFISTHYRVRVHGIKNIPATGGVLLLGNHVSWIDWAVVQIACPRQVRFVMTSTIYNKWYLKWFFDLFHCIPISSNASSRQSLEAIAEALNAGDVVCLFPEGVISRTGHLTEFRRGFELACEKVDDDVKIVPFFLRGLWGSRFSRSSRHLMRTTARGMTRELFVDFGTPEPRTLKADALKQKVVRLSMESWRKHAATLPALGERWVEASKRRGNPLVLLDTMGTELRAKQALTGSVLLARRIARLSPEQNIGLLLPTTAGGMLANMAAMLLGKTAVNLNFTASQDALFSAMKQADIRTVYSSERFLKKLGQRGFDVEALKGSCKVVALESFAGETSKAEKISTLLMAFALPAVILKRLWCRNQDPDSSAVILFSSGSEGEPKGVMLSHRNILSNVKQVAELLNMEDDDVIMANLPLFHAFGLTVTQFLPLLERIPVVCHPDPTDVYGSAKAVAMHDVTVMFGTSSFFRLYVRNSKVHPLMLESLRLVVAGAEKLQPDVRREFRLKFNRDILEGYGATETAPVASVNMPDSMSTEDWKVQVSQKAGSVGMALPGTSFMITDPDTFAPLPTGEAGMILISGSQVMQGYLNNPEKTSAVLLEIDGTIWYATGDKGYLDEDGFLFIQDRYSRFAKIGGEMVGLGKVEQCIRDAVNEADFDVVAVNLPDEKKGEKIVVLTNRVVDGDALRQQLSTAGLNSLALPAAWLVVEEIPTLGSGKKDFNTARKLALELLEAA